MRRECGNEPRLWSPKRKPPARDGFSRGSFHFSFHAVQQEDDRRTSSFVVSQAILRHQQVQNPPVVDLALEAHGLWFMQVCLFFWGTTPKGVSLRGKLKQTHPLLGFRSFKTRHMISLLSCSVTLEKREPFLGRPSFSGAATKKGTRVPLNN